MNIGLGFFVVAVVALGGGCASHKADQMPPGPSATAPASAVGDKRVMTDPGFDAVAKVVGVSEGPGSEGFLRAEFQVQNTTATVQSIGYRIEWTDRNGAPIDVPRPMPPMTLMANETAPVAAMAPSPIAKNFQATFFLVNH